MKYFAILLSFILLSLSIYAQNKNKRINYLINSIEEFGLENLYRWSYHQRYVGSPDCVMFSYEINDSIRPYIEILYIRRSEYFTLLKKNKLKDTIFYYINGKLLKEPIQPNISDKHPYTLEDVKKLETFFSLNSITAMYWYSDEIKFETRNFILYYFYPTNNEKVLATRRKFKNDYKNIKGNWFIWNN